MNQPHSGLLRWIYYIIGATSLVLGVIGVFLPVLPTVPFILFSAFCFSKSSPRLHGWLVTSKWFGPSIRDWEQHGAIRLPAKLGATAFMLFSLAYSIFIRGIPKYVPYIIGFITVAALSYIWSRPSGPRS